MESTAQRAADKVRGRTRLYRRYLKPVIVRRPDKPAALASPLPAMSQEDSEKRPSEVQVEAQPSSSKNKGKGKVSDLTAAEAQTGGEDLLPW